jgi:cystathionine beta-lyase/cystathionine gamma-synthase
MSKSRHVIRDAAPDDAPAPDGQAGSQLDLREDVRLNRTYEHIVLGVGGISSAAAYWLAKRGGKNVAAHPAVRRVHYPGLPGHPGHLLATKQVRGGFGGVVSMEVHGGPDAAGRVCERTEVFTLAVWLGSVESLIEHPARMTHCTTAGTPVSVSDSLLRLSIGLEDCDELIADLGQALAG